MHFTLPVLIIPLYIVYQAVVSEMAKISKQQFCSLCIAVKWMLIPQQFVLGFCFIEFDSLFSL